MTMGSGMRWGRGLTASHVLAWGSAKFRPRAGTGSPKTAFQRGGSGAWAQTGDPPLPLLLLLGKPHPARNGVLVAEPVLHA